MASTLARTAVPVATVHLRHSRRFKPVSNRSLCRAGKQVEGTAANDTESKSDDDTDEQSYSKYSESSGAVKTLVSGLTSIMNAFGAVKDADTNNEATRKERRDARPYPTTPRTPESLAIGIEKEFTDAKYLWTGYINPEMYDLFCTFTDPTLSFAGLDKFERNLKNLQPVLKLLVKESNIKLYDCGLVDEKNNKINKVRASWRMVGSLNLPWRPKIDLKGRTTFTFNDFGGERGCLIMNYSEEWELSAGKAVGQLVKPFQWG